MEWEREQDIDKQEVRFQQAVLASSIGPWDPKMYWRMFDPDNIPGETQSDDYIPGVGKIEQPTSMAEFEEMFGGLRFLEELSDESDEEAFEEPDGHFAQAYPPHSYVEPQYKTYDSGYPGQSM